MSKRETTPASLAVATDTGDSGQVEAVSVRAGCKCTLQNPVPLWLPGSLLNNCAKLFPLGKSKIHGQNWTRVWNKPVLNGQTLLSWTLWYQGLVVMWSGHKGKVADSISLCMFSPSHSESGQTVRWKNRAQEGKWKSWLPYTLSALPLSGLSWSWVPAQLVGNDRKKESCPKGADGIWGIVHMQECPRKIISI